VCILTTKSGDRRNTNDPIISPSHPNRTVLFLDNAVPIPFVFDPENPTTQYQMGFSLSDTIRKRLDDFGPDVVHITVPDCTGLHVVDYARSRSLPLMGTFHSNMADYMDHYPGMLWLKPIISGFLRHQYNFFHTLFVPTPFMRQRLIETDKMDRITKVRIWGRGVDVDFFSPMHRSLEFRRRLGFDDDDVVVLFVGRLVPEKRPDIFADVVKRLAAEGRGLRFKALVVGAGPYQDEMKALPNTTCLGWVGGAELAVAYASSDIFLFPSSVETFGNVTLEAAASGLALVVDGGCSGHLVQDDMNGYGVGAGDADAYYHATRSLIVDSTERARLASASRPLSLHFDKSKISKEMLRNYDDVVDDFYNDYDGSHLKRDAAYVNPDSFRGGMLPRPYGMRLVEVFFTGSFHVIYYLLGIYLWVQEVFVMPMILRLRRMAASRTGVSKKEALASVGKDEDACRPTAVVFEDLNPATRAMAVSSRSSSLAADTDPFHNINTSILPAASTESFLTGTTSSSSSETSSDAAADNNMDLEAVNASSSCAKHIANIGDGPAARMLAVWFVRTVLFCWRTSAWISIKLGIARQQHRIPQLQRPTQFRQEHVEKCQAR